MLNTKADNLDVYERAKADDAQWEREHDSHEKIEAEVRELGRNTWWVKKVLGWLDRQANITARDSGRWRSKYMDLLDERRELEGMIDELQVKVDELNAQNTRLNAGWAEANVRVEKLQAKLDNLKGPDCDCCSWKAKVDELQAANKPDGKFNAPKPPENIEIGAPRRDYGYFDAADGVKYRETRVEYTESFGEAYKTLSIETFTTLDELRGLCAGLMGVCDE